MPTIRVPNPARVVRGYRRLHDRLTARLTAALRPTIRTASQDAVKTMLAGGSLFDAAFSIETHRGEFQDRMRPQWNRVIQSGIDFEVDWLNANPQISDRPSVGFLGNIRRWIAERSIEAWRRATRWILRRLGRKASVGIPGTLAYRETMREAAETMDFVARLMALMETTYGLNTGGHHVRFELGVGTKVWLSTIDDRTRNEPKYNHVIPHGQIQPNERAFFVSGESLMFPGDVTLGATMGNIAGCRCLALGFREGF